LYFCSIEHSLSISEKWLQFIKNNEEKLMSDLTEKHCIPCESGVAPLTAAAATQELSKLSGWQINKEVTEISKRFVLKNFFRTMAFVNAIAWIANKENHHPDMEVSYNYCHVRFSTHAIKGLSMNDFICAAKVDTLEDL
jgi:4a-hydroxytetrahydrobiopterin dehydratase